MNIVCRKLLANLKIYVAPIHTIKIITKQLIGGKASGYKRPKANMTPYVFIKKLSSNKKLLIIIDAYFVNFYRINR